MKEKRTIWSTTDKAAVLAAEVEIDGHYDFVSLSITHGPCVILAIEEDGSFTVSILRKDHNVRIEADRSGTNGDLEECTLSFIANCTAIAKATEPSPVPSA